MHMADALVSPAVGGTLWTAGAALTYYSAKKIGVEFHAQKAPLMGVLGAFVFAVQMINFAIPGTGSSGHLGGGVLLAVLLGPYAGFLTMASVLTVQALLFADGGLLALGCNIINLAFFPCIIAYPLIYRTIAGDHPSQVRMTVAVAVAAIAGLQLGALGVIAETMASGISELPFGTFALFMLPIHLVIGLVEAAVTSVVLSYVWKEAPDLFRMSTPTAVPHSASIRRILWAVAAAAILTAGMLSWFASSNPDGLEWAVQRTSGQEKVENFSPVHETLASWQEKIALFPDYQLAMVVPGEVKADKKEENSVWPSVSEKTSAAGLIGASLTLLLAGAIGIGCRFIVKRNAS